MRAAKSGFKVRFSILPYKVKLQCPARKTGYISLLSPCYEGMETTRSCPFGDYSGIRVFEDLLSISLTSEANKTGKPVMLL